MKVSRIMIVAVAIVLAMSAVSVAQWDKFAGGQYTINLKTGPLPIGGGWDAKGIYCHFAMTDFAQDFIYLGATKGWFTPYLGAAGNWDAHDRLMVGSFIDIPLLSRLTSNTELDLMILGKQADIYYWQGVEYSDTLWGQSAVIGVQAETVSKHITKTQCGFHASFNQVSLATYFGPGGWNYRLGFTIWLNK